MEIRFFSGTEKIMQDSQAVGGVQLNTL